MKGDLEILTQETLLPNVNKVSFDGQRAIQGSMNPLMFTLLIEMKATFSGCGKLKMPQELTERDAGTKFKGLVDRLGKQTKVQHQ